MRGPRLPTACLAALPLIGTTGGGAAEGSWTGLDQEIARLSSRLSEQDGGPAVGGFLRLRGAWSNDVDLDPAAPGSQHMGGFALDDARIEIDGRPREGWRYRVSLEAGHQGELDTFAGPGVDLLDAFVETRLCPGAYLDVGQFCSVFLWSACNFERNLLFLDRSFLAENWDGRDVGAQLVTRCGPLDAWLAVQDGFDGKQSHDAFTARAVYRAIGEGGWCCEGACFGGGRRLAFGASVFEDRSMDHGTAVGFDALYVWERFSAHAETVHYGRDMRPMPEIDPAIGAIVPGMMDPAGSETPWDATIGYAIVPDRWEAAVRAQVLDDERNTSIYSIVLDRYVGSRNVKWTAEYDRSRSDDPSLEFGAFGIGLTVGM